VDAAFDILRDGGVEAVKVDHLTRALGVTKGSFYWHFSKRADLLDAVLAQWANDQIEVYTALANAASDDPRERLLELNKIFRQNKSMATARALRDWARSDQDAAAAVTTADNKMYQYLVHAFSDLGFHGADAELRAKVWLYSGVGPHLLGHSLGESNGRATPEQLLEILTAH